MSEIDTPAFGMDGGPALPVNELDQVTGFIAVQHLGASMLDQFAMGAMQAMISGSWPDSNERREIAKRSYLMAKDMLSARELALKGES